MGCANIAAVFRCAKSKDSKMNSAKKSCTNLNGNEVHQDLPTQYLHALGKDYQNQGL